MSNSRPYMPLYIADYNVDTEHLTIEEDGAYSRLLRSMWVAGGKLPNDEKILTQICRISLKRWRKIAPTILAFFTIVDGHLEQKRMNRELQKLARVSAARKAAGKQGGRPKQAEVTSEAPAKKEEDSSPLTSQNETAKPLRNGPDDKANALPPRARSRDARAPLETSDLRQENSDEFSFTAPPAAPPPKTSKRGMVKAAFQGVLSPDHAAAIIEHRRELHHPLTAYAATRLASRYLDAEAICGLTPDQAVDYQIDKGWRGFDPEWVLRDRAIRQSTGPPSSFADQDEQRMRETQSFIDRKIAEGK